MCIGQDDMSTGKKRLNLTQLRKNARSRKEKKSGRKRPRPGDCDVISAPDAQGNKHVLVPVYTALLQCICL